jgi:hypothetical protein
MTTTAPVKNIIEQENYPTLHLHIKVKEQSYYSYSTFHSHSRVFNNEDNSYPKMSVKQPLTMRIIRILKWMWNSL